MATITPEEVKKFLMAIQGREITLKQIRDEFHILSGTQSYDTVRTILSRLADQKIIRLSGKHDGVYKVVTQVEPVQIFGIDRERRPPFKLWFPKDFETAMEMSFADDIVIREGDLILISGVSNLGKTGLCLNFVGENIDYKPVLMGNEYTNPGGEPMPRFIGRLDGMSIKNGGWVNWVDEAGKDKFTLLPVHDDYAEHIVKDRINIIDWINIESGEHYMIGTILNNIKKQLGKGIAIIAIQKAEGADAGRGGQFTKDFADCEILIDKLGNSETLLTIGKVKEYTNPVSGRHFGFTIAKGVKILNFREVKRCDACKGTGFQAGKPCSDCAAKKWVDK